MCDYTNIGKNLSNNIIFNINSIDNYYNQNYMFNNINMICEIMTNIITFYNNIIYNTIVIHKKDINNYKYLLTIFDININQNNDKIINDIVIRFNYLHYFKKSMVTKINNNYNEKTVLEYINTSVFNKYYYRLKHLHLVN